MSQKIHVYVVAFKINNDIAELTYATEHNIQNSHIAYGHYKTSYYLNGKECTVDEIKRYLNLGKFITITINNEVLDKLYYKELRS